MSQEEYAKLPPPPPNLRTVPTTPPPTALSNSQTVNASTFIPPPPPPPRLSATGTMKITIEAAKTAILPPPIAKLPDGTSADMLVNSNVEIYGTLRKVGANKTYSSPLENKNISHHPSTPPIPPPPRRTNSSEWKLKQSIFPPKPTEAILNNNNNNNNNNINNNFIQGNNIVQLLNEELSDEEDNSKNITGEERKEEKVKFFENSNENTNQEKPQTRVNIKLKKPPQRPLSQSYEPSKITHHLEKKPLSSSNTNDLIASKVFLRRDCSPSKNNSLPPPPPRSRPISSKLVPLNIDSDQTVEEDKNIPPPPPSRINRRPLSSKIDNFIAPPEDSNHTSADEVEDCGEDYSTIRAIKRSDTVSRITSDWAELETEIMSTPGDTEAQSNRLSRTNIGTNISSAIESERMKFLLVNHQNDGSQKNSQFLSKMGNEKIQTDRIKTLEQMLKDHQRALNSKMSTSNKAPASIPGAYPMFQISPFHPPPPPSESSYPPPPPPPPPPIKKSTGEIIHETTLKTKKEKDKESDLLVKLKRKMSSKKKNDELTQGPSASSSSSSSSSSNQPTATYSNENEIPDSVLFFESKKYLDSFLPMSRNNDTHFVETLKENCKVRSVFHDRVQSLCFDEFECEDTEDQIIFENDELSYSTFCKLIQQLTHHKIATSAVLISTFLLTFRAFFEPLQLLELLIFRFYGAPSEPDPKWEKEKNIPIKTRVFVVLMKWIDKFYEKDFAPNGQVMQLLAMWLDDQDNMPKELSSMLDVVKRTIGRNIMKKRVETDYLQKKKKPPKPHIPKISANLKLTDIHPTEIARQLAVIEKSIFDRIGPAECLRQGWAKAGKESHSPNIYQMIMRFNIISNWVASEIVKVEDLKERAVVLNRFIIIAEESRALSNYNAVMEILAGLQSAPIYRLKNTWSLLPSKTWDIWDNLNEIMSNDDNFSLYRTTLKNSKPPCIPYIGIYLTDLVFVDDGNLDYKPDTDLINITKLRFTASITFGLDQFQQKKYNLVEVPIVQQYLASPPYLPEDKLKELSLKVEPRQ